MSTYRPHRGDTPGGGRAGDGRAAAQEEAVSDIDDLLARINARIDDDELVACDAGGRDWMREDYGCIVDAADNRLIAYGEGTPSREQADHIVRHDPARVLREVEATRNLLAEVMSWPHFYLDQDGWYSCSQAVDPHDPDAEPGSGCLDGDRAGKPCDCGLDRRRKAILEPIAQAYRERR